MTATMDLRIRDNSDNTIFWLNNYTLSITAGAGYEDVVISGKFYDPIHGFVVISTPVPMRIYDPDAYPSSGTLRLDGQGASSVTLTALSNVQFNLVIVDVNGTTVADITDDWVNL